MLWMPLHGLLSLIAVAAVVVGTVFLVRYIWNAAERSDGRRGRSAALDALDFRYARGEIDRDEYLRRKQDLVLPHGG